MPGTSCCISRVLRSVPAHVHEESSLRRRCGEAATDFRAVTELRRVWGGQRDRWPCNRAKQSGGGGGQEVLILFLQLLFDRNYIKIKRPPPNTEQSGMCVFPLLPHPKQSLRRTWERGRAATTDASDPRASAHAQIRWDLLQAALDSLLKIKYKRIATGQLAFLLRHSGFSHFSVWPAEQRTVY